MKPKVQFREDAFVLFCEHKSLKKVLSNSGGEKKKGEKERTFLDTEKLFFIKHVLSSKTKTQKPGRAGAPRAVLSYHAVFTSMATHCCIGEERFGGPSVALTHWLWWPGREVNQGG